MHRPTSACDRKCTKENMHFDRLSREALGASWYLSIDNKRSAKIPPSTCTGIAEELSAELKSTKAHLDARPIVWLLLLRWQRNKQGKAKYASAVSSWIANACAASPQANSHIHAKRERTPILHTKISNKGCGEDDCREEKHMEIELVETLDWAGGSTFTPVRKTSSSTPPPPACSQGTNTQDFDLLQEHDEADNETQGEIEYALCSVLYQLLQSGSDTCLETSMQDANPVAPDTLSYSGSTKDDTRQGKVLLLGPVFMKALVERICVPSTETPPPQAEVLLRNTLKAIIHRAYDRFVDQRTTLLAAMVGRFFHLLSKFDQKKTNTGRSAAVTRGAKRSHHTPSSGRARNVHPLQSKTAAGIHAEAKKKIKSGGGGVVKNFKSTIPPWKTRGAASTATVLPWTAEEKAALVFTGAPELLEVAGSIICGFNTKERALSSSPLKRALRTCILSLHAIMGMKDEFTPFLGLYHKPLSYCIVQMMKKDEETGVAWVQYVLNHWPSIYAKMETLLVGEMEEVLEHMTHRQFDRVATKVSSLWVTLLESFNFAVVQRVCILLSNDKVLRLLNGSQATGDPSEKLNSSKTASASGRAIATKLSLSLYKTATQHFNDTSRQMCFRVLEKLGNVVDPSILSQRQFKKLKVMYEQREAEEKRQQALKKKGMTQKKTGLGFLDFGFGKTLGVGSYSTVKYAKLIGSHASQTYWEEYALKIMDKKHILDTEYTANAIMELKLLKKMCHPNVVKLISTFETEEKLFLVLEYADGGDVFHVLERYGSVQPEYARFIVAETVLALQYLHETMRVAHLDIKPENLLLADGHVRLTDFGSACSFFVPKEKESVGRKQDASTDTKATSDHAMNDATATTRRRTTTTQDTRVEDTPTLETNEREMSQKETLEALIEDGKKLPKETAAIEILDEPQTTKGKKAKKQAKKTTEKEVNQSITAGGASVPEASATTRDHCAPKANKKKANSKRHKQQRQHRVRFAGTAEYVAPELAAHHLAATTNGASGPTVAESSKDTEEEEDKKTIAPFTEQTARADVVNTTDLGAADLYSLGCVLYQLLAGRPPFFADTDAALFSRIAASVGDQHVSGLEFPKDFPGDAKDLCHHLLNPDPKKRLGAASTGGYSALKAHPFFKGVSWDSLSSLRPEEIPVATQGAVQKDAVPLKLRQRRYSMMLTKTIAAKYMYENFTLDPIEEVFFGTAKEDARAEEMVLRSL